MAWSLVGSTSNYSSTQDGTETVTLPGTPQEGDIVVVVAASDQADGGTPVDISTSGYTKWLTGNNFPRGVIGWKRLGASPDSSVAIERTNRAYNTCWAVQVWRGGDSSQPDAALVTASGGSGDPNSPSITTTSDDALVLSFGLLDDDSATLNNPPTGYSNAILQNANAAAGSSCTVMIASKEVATAGAENPGVWDTSHSDAWYAGTLALAIEASVALNGEDVEQAQEVSKPAIGHIHNLAGDDVEMEMRVTDLDWDALDSSYATIDDVTDITFDSAGAPSLTEQIGTVDLLAEDVEQSQEVTQPAVGQVHALQAADVEQNQEVTSPSIAQVHALAADDVEQSGDVSSPTISQAHSLTAADAEQAQEVSAPALGQAHALVASDVEGAQEVTQPSVGQAHALLAADVEQGQELSSPNVGQSHDLTGESVEQAGEVTRPEIGQAHALLANDAEQMQEVSSPSIAQVHALSATSIEQATEVSSPAIGQIHQLFAGSVEQAMAVSVPAIGQEHDLNGEDVEQAMEVTSPSIAQAHALKPVNVEQAQEVSMPVLVSITPERSWPSWLNERASRERREQARRRVEGRGRKAQRRFQIALEGAKKKRKPRQRVIRLAENIDELLERLGWEAKTPQIDRIVEEVDNTARLLEQMQKQRIDRRVTERLAALQQLIRDAIDEAEGVELLLLTLAAA